MTSITDSLMTPIVNQQTALFSQTKNQIQKRLPKIENSIQDINAFSENVRSRGKTLQEAEHGPVTAANLTELIKEQKKILESYESFQKTYAKIPILINQITQSIKFLTPQPRSWSDENALKNSNPALYEETIKREATCKGYVNTLQEHHNKILNLKNQLFSQINDTTLLWSLQRICEIVKNNGNPLPTTSRAVNYVWPYAVTPTFPKSSEIHIPAKNKP